MEYPDATDATKGSIAANPRERALARWDNEGGALDHGGRPRLLPAPETKALSDAELIRLRVRVIALENIVIALLATGTTGQRELATEMADIIRPRDGAVAHPLTIEAATLIDGLVQRSIHFANAAT